MKELVTITNDKPTTTSLKVAEIFEKRHDNVIRTIKTIQNTLKSLGRDLLSFEEITYEDSNNRTQTAYQMDRDAFSVLVFGFTGEKALGYRVDFVKTFNELELELMKTKTELLDLTDIPTALNLIAKRLQKTASSKAIPESIKKPVKKTTKSVQKNNKTMSVRTQLPMLGLRPRLTTDWLVKKGFLKRELHNWPSKATYLKVPTEMGKDYFKLVTGSALHITPKGKQLLITLLETQQIPFSCTIAAC